MNKNNLQIKLGNEEDFFKQALSIAKKLDNKELIKSEHIIMFEDPEEMLQFLTPKKREVINAIRVHPWSSITEISKFVQRNVSSVSRDINSMIQVGILEVEDAINPGHGKVRRVSVPFDNMTLQASL